MATVSDILSTKSGRKVETIAMQSTVFDAAVTMNQHQIGALVVLDQDRLKGIITERDVLQRVIAEKRDPSATSVEQTMTTEVAFCRPDTSIEEAKTVMKMKRIRHLPVVDADRKLAGMISIGDLNAYHTDTQEATILYLHEYIYGRT